MSIDAVQYSKTIYEIDGLRKDEHKIVDSSQSMRNLAEDFNDHVKDEKIKPSTLANVYHTYKLIHVNSNCLFIEKGYFEFIFVG